MPSGPFSICHLAILRPTQHSRGEAAALFSQLSRRICFSGVLIQHPAKGRGPREGASALLFVWGMRRTSLGGIMLAVGKG